MQKRCAKSTYTNVQQEQIQIWKRDTYSTTTACAEDSRRDMPKKYAKESNTYGKEKTVRLPPQVQRTLGATCNRHLLKESNTNMQKEKIQMWERDNCSTAAAARSKTLDATCKRDLQKWQIWICKKDQYWYRTEIPVSLLPQHVQRTLGATWRRVASPVPGVCQIWWNLCHKRLTWICKRPIKETYRTMPKQFCKRDQYKYSKKTNTNM